MLNGEMLEYLTSIYKLKKPFVAFRKPNDGLIKVLSQKNSKIYFVKDFTESGFVFAPFSSEKKVILFPYDFCDTETFNMSQKSQILRPFKNSSFNSTEKNEHKALVKKGIDVVKSMRLQKVVLSRVETVKVSEDNPVVIFESLLTYYAEAFVYIWFHPKVGLWLGATPETLLKVEGQRFQTMSLAGTQVYKESERVKWNQKNLEEQDLVTNYIEAQLKPIVENLKIDPLETVRAGRLLHLKSKISGILKPDLLKQVIESIHPTPAVCGIPKNIATSFIVDNESYDREFYTGYLGELNVKVAQTRNTNKRNIENNAYSSIKNTSELYVNLRCMQFINQNALIYVGGGITKDSNPEEEWEETVNKSQTMLRVLNTTN